jgi:hypothetical protein
VQRRWMVRPDPETGVANRQDIVEALMDGEALLARAGGGLTILTYRVPTEVPGEMETEAVLFEWRDRTDAKPQPEQPQPKPSTVTVERQPDPTPDELEHQLTVEDALQEENLGMEDPEERLLREAEQGEDTSSLERVQG